MMNAPTPNPTMTSTSGAGTARWAPTPVSTPSTRKAPAEEAWSSAQEVIDLLRYDGRLDGSLEERRFRRRRVKAGQSAFRMGQPFDGLYVVRLGSIKSTVTHDDGNEHVLSFSMKGDLIGFDGVCRNQFASEAVALTDCDLIRLPANEMFTPGRTSNDIERMAYWAISREIVKEQAAYASSHAAKSEARVARFIRLQSERFAAMGYSPRAFTLPMTRRDIGSYLSVTLETVSRALSALHQSGIIEVAKRDITILSPQALRDFEG